MILLDGFTWPGVGVLARGDVVAVPERETAAWAATCDRTAASFLDDLSVESQLRRWGVVMLAEAKPDDLGGLSASDEPGRGIIVPGGLPAVIAPRNVRLTPEGSVPLISGFYGDGPVTIVPDRQD